MCLKQPIKYIYLFNSRINYYSVHGENANDINWNCMTKGQESQRVPDSAAVGWPGRFNDDVHNRDSLWQLQQGRICLPNPYKLW